jgi:hypothetical protein
MGRAVYNATLPATHKPLYAKNDEDRGLMTAVRPMAVQVTTLSLLYWLSKSR